MTGHGGGGNREMQSFRDQGTQDLSQCVLPLHQGRLGGRIRGLLALFNEEGLVSATFDWDGVGLGTESGAFWDQGLLFCLACSPSPRT